VSSVRERLEQYARENSKRAEGGLYSLSGFDFELRLYLAKLVESLCAEEEAPLLEAFSDIAEKISSNIVLTQVKRTLNKTRLREAADEIAVIDDFLEKHDPGLRSSARFQIVCSRRDDELTDLSEGIWSGVEVPIAARGRERKNARLA
jgi:hypothetical protein